MTQYTISKKTSNYAPSNSQSSYATSSSTSYHSSNSINTSQLQVVQGQVKEKSQGICTCQKKVACRGTCRT